LKATDIQAALGVSQIQKLPDFIQARKNNYKYLFDRLSLIKGLSFMNATTKSDPSWFGFPIIIEDSLGINRRDLLKFLDSRKIASRLIFAGNILKHPAYKDIKHRVYGNLNQTDKIMNNGFWVGVYPGLNQVMLDYVIESINYFIQKETK
jgi:CDP-6-deoxy-D-xylo-4-hexulose-3-dehydrase